MPRHRSELRHALDDRMQNYERASRGSSFPTRRMAAAVALAGTSIFSLEIPASCEVVFTPTDKILKGFDGSYIQVNFPDAAFHIAAESAYSRYYCAGSNRIVALGWPGTNQEVVVNPAGYAAAGHAAQIVGSEDTFALEAVMAKRSVVSSQQHRCHTTSGKGPWKNLPTEHFIGVKFTVSDGIHYGWIRLIKTTAYGAEMTGYAYETIPNKPLPAGFTAHNELLPQSSQLPSNGLGTLAAGALGRQ